MKEQSVLLSTVLIALLMITVLSLHVPTGQGAKTDGTSINVVNPFTGDEWFNFTSLQMNVGDTFVVNITITEVTNLYYWQVSLVWDPALLDFVSVELPSDHVFAGQSYIPGEEVFTGNVIYALALNPGMNSFNGSGTLCQITLKIMQNVSASNPEVNSTLAISNPDADTLLLDPQLGSISFLPVNGYYDYAFLPQLEVDQYTLALWHFNEGSGQTVYDSSPHGNNGTFGVGREPSWRGRALSFDDGYDYVIFPDNPDGSLNLLGGNQFTIEFWTYLRQISRDGYSWNEFMSKNQGTQTGWGICQCTAIPMIQAYFWYDPTNNFQNNAINPPPTYEWVHIKVIYDGHFLYVFFNDALQIKQDVGSHFVANNSQPLTIGKDLGGDVPWNDAVDGIIDEVRISSIARLHDVSSTDIVPSKTVVGKGYSAQINVTVANRGAFTETFNATAQANDTAIGTQTASNLNMNTSAFMTFGWNTTEFAYGNYTLENCADVVPGEVNTDDNNCTCTIQVHVGVPGDVSGATVGVYDGKCDMRDIAYLVSLFNTRPSSSKWNPNADVNNDAVCNMKDIAIAVLHFGQHE